MKRLIALALLALPASAHAQTFPGLMPNNTVICNISGVSALGIPCASIILKGTVQFLAPTASSGLADGVVDTTAVIANQAAFWTGFNAAGATPGNPTVHTFNRMLVGEISTKSTGCHIGSQSWIHTLFGSDCESGQIAVTSTLGTFAITAAVRTSDFRTWKGAASQGSSAASFFGVNDDTGAGGPIMDTINNEAVVMPGVTGATLNAQFNMDNVCCNHITDPFIGFRNANLLLTPGGTPPSGFGAGSEFNIDAALIIGNSSGFGPRFNTGINMQDDSIQIDAGPTVNGVASTVAMALSSRYAVVWYTSTGTASGAIYSGTAQKLTLWARNNINLQANDGTGTIDINPGANGGININTVPGVSCGPGAPSGAFRTINGIVVAC